MFFNWPLFILTAVVVLLYHLQIIFNEEGHLEQAFEEPYLRYRSQVNRYWGRKKQKQKDKRSKKWNT